MGTKQILMEFQVVADDGVSADVTVTINGVQKFSGPVAQTVTVMPGQVLDDQVPYSSIQFDLDVDDLPADPGDATPWGQWVVSRDITVAVSGGDITMQATEANYTATLAPNAPPAHPPYQLVPGNSTNFYQIFPMAQPLWNGVALTQRFNYQYNVDNGTGPGSILVLDGETVAYPLGVTFYSA